MRSYYSLESRLISDNNSVISSVGRDHVIRAKIAVLSHDSSIDPIGACVGMRGSRVQAVVQELQGEKVDIIPWSPEVANFIVNALAPAEVSKVLMDEEKNKAEVVVPDDQLSLAIGRRGQNVKLASQLTGWEIDIMTEAEESERRQKETRERTELFKTALDVDDVIAHLLVAEGYAAVEDVSDSEIEDLQGVEGFDEDIATELQRRAREYIEKRDAELANRLEELGVAEEVRSAEGLTLPMLVALGEQGVKSLDDLADLASDELREIVGESAMDGETANAIIMKAREHWFPAEEAASGEAAKA
jgi:N utilization substance protein A